MKLTVNELNLSSDTLTIPAKGSANVKIEVENISDKYRDYAIVPCIGWIENGVVVSSTREIINNIFTLPYEFFKNAGAVYIAVGLVKDTEKIKTNEITFFISDAPDAEIELPSDGTWETSVSLLVSSLFDERFKNEINEILEDSKNLNNNTKTLQERINAAINHMGQYEWDGTKIRFKKGDGTWGVYKDIAGDFAKETEVAELKNAFNSVTSLTKQLFLLMHPVGSIYMSTFSTSPQTTFGGTWIRWGNGRVPVGIDTSDSDFNTVEKTGGEKQHTLTINEMPSHSHEDAKPRGLQNTATGSAQYGYIMNGSYSSTAFTGGSEPHNNLQPYITCYMWKRTA